MIHLPISPSSSFAHTCLRLAIAVAAIFLSADILAASCERPQRLRFAIVPQDNLSRDIEAMQPLFDALQAATGLQVEVAMPSSYGAVVEGLLAGAIDLANLGPAAYISAKKADQRIIAFASTAKKKGPFQEEGGGYHSLLIVRAKGPYTSLESLRGKKLALVDPDSTSGALIPRHAFSSEVKTPLQTYFSQIGYAGSHDKSALAVANGRVDAAFVSSYLLSSLVEAGTPGAQDFRVLWRSARMPLNPFVYRDQLCAGIKDKIRAVFLSQGGKSNPALLARLKAVAFVPVDDADYQILRDLP